MTAENLEYDAEVTETAAIGFISAGQSFRVSIPGRLRRLDVGAAANGIVRCTFNIVDNNGQPGTQVHQEDFDMGTAAAKFNVAATATTLQPLVLASGFDVVPGAQGITCLQPGTNPGWRHRKRPTIYF